MRGHYGMIVRTVEAPFFWRVVSGRRFGDPAPAGSLYKSLVARLRDLLGAPGERPSAHTAPTRDGKGIIFVAHDGEVYPAGFLPVGLGNVRRESLTAVYRMTRCYGPSGLRSFLAAVAAASTRTCAADLGLGLTRLTEIRWLKIRPARSSRVLMGRPGNTPALELRASD